MRADQQPVADAAGAGGGLRLAAVTVPAADRHVAFVRLAAEHVADAVGLGSGRAADLRLAVDEAYGQFVAEVPAGSPARHRASVVVHFELSRGRLRVTMRGPVTTAWPQRDGLGWTVLSALVGELDWTSGGGVGTLAFVEQLPVLDELGYAAL